MVLHIFRNDHLYIKRALLTKGKWLNESIYSLQQNWVWRDSFTLTQQVRWLRPTVAWNWRTALRWGNAEAPEGKRVEAGWVYVKELYRLSTTETRLLLHLDGEGVRVFTYFAFANSVWHEKWIVKSRTLRTWQNIIESTHSKLCCRCGLTLNNISEITSQE